MPAGHLRRRVVERIHDGRARVEPVVQPPSARRGGHQHEREGVATGGRPPRAHAPPPHRALRVEGLRSRPRTTDAGDPAPEHPETEHDRAHTEDDRQHEHRDIRPGEGEHAERHLGHAPREGEHARADPSPTDRAPDGREAADHEQHGEHRRQQLEAAAQPDEHGDARDDPRRRHRAGPPARGATDELEDAHDHGARAHVHAQEHEGGERAREDQRAEHHHDDADDQEHPRGRVAHEGGEGVPPAQLRSAGGGHQAMIGITSAGPTPLARTPPRRLRWRDVDPRPRRRP